MMNFTIGNILASDADALVNTVNCVGVMGRGIALQYKKAFPSNFKAYEVACKRGEVQPGKMFVYETLQQPGPKYIINFPTKRHWRGKSRMEDIETGLVDLVEVVRTTGVRSIAIPPLGSGLGGLNWADVRPRIEKALAGAEGLTVTVFEPAGAPALEEMAKSRKVPRMSPGRAALIGLMHRYLGGLMDPFVSLIEVHKLMYFMQAAGQPLKLQWEKGRYGPYAKNLHFVLNDIEGHLVSGFADGGDDPGKQLTLIPGAIEDAGTFLVAETGTRDRFDRVGDLVDGFETPFGLELLATVHWVATREGAYYQDEAVERVRAWNARKQQFSPRQIGIALEALASKGWIAGVDTLTR